MVTRYVYWETRVIATVIESKSEKVKDLVSVDETSDGKNPLSIIFKNGLSKSASDYLQKMCVYTGFLPFLLA